MVHVQRQAALQSAVIEVKDSALTLKADYGSREPKNSAPALEALLKVWGASSKEPVYFMGLRDGSRYGMSATTDPGRWTPEEFPRVEIRRQSPGRHVAAFHVSGLSAPRLFERMQKALEAFVAAETGVKRLTASSNGEEIIFDRGK